MPGDAGPEGRPPAQPADDLAKDLPGLPLELGKVRVDEDGFHQPARWRRPAVDIAWADVVAVRRQIDWIGVWGPLADDGRRQCVGVQGKKAARKRVNAAWREYVLRQIERDGVLRGEFCGILTRDELPTTYFVLASLACIGVWGLWHFHRLPPAVREANLVAELCLWALVVVGLVSFVMGVVTWRELREDRDRWSRWELGPRGITYWDGTDLRRLKPGSEDAATWNRVEMSGVRIPLARLSHGSVAVALLYAMAERSGARTGPGWIAVRLTLTGLTTVAGAAALVVFTGLLTSWKLLLLMVIGSLVTVAVVPVMMVLWHLKSRKRLADGRAMLERLGW